MTPPEELEGRTYYHGTSPTSAVCISEEGFRILDSEIRFWGGALGTGIYVTRRLKESLIFGALQSKRSTYVLRVELARGTKIARLDDEPNPKVLDSLRREFGHEILGPRFANAIPSNKHLKPRELFALIGYLEKSRVLFEERSAKQHVRKWLLRLGYDGYGHSQNDLGIMLFDPSRLAVRGVQQLPEWGDMDRPTLLEVTHAELAADAEAELLRVEGDLREEDEDPEWQAELATDAEMRRRSELERAELERRRRLLDQYQQRHGVA